LTNLVRFFTIVVILGVGLNKKQRKEAIQMAMQRWQPVSELVSLRQAMDRLFEDSFVRPSRLLTSLGEAAAPALDVYQTPSEVVVKTALPGLKPEDINIDITGDTLTIRAETKGEQDIKKEDYLYQERRYGAFSRSMVLPGGLKRDKAEASLGEGILTLSIPKAEEAKPKAIKVKPKEKK